MTVKRYRKRNRFPKFPFILILIVTAFFIFLEIRVKPVINGFAEVNAKSLATSAINHSVAEILEENEITCEDLENISYSNSRITAINSNTVNVNKLKSSITLRIQRNLSDIKNREIHIPIGSLIGGELMHGRGFTIPVNISMSGNVNTDFISSFEHGGINQTVHTLSVKVSADVTVRLPNGYTNTSVETTVLIGETVIIGEVPSGILYSAK